MIARTSSGRVPLEQAGGSHRHLLETGVSGYQQEPSCLAVRVWRQGTDGWAGFLLPSLWRDLEAISSYAGSTPEVVVLYSEEDAFGLVPDETFAHYQILSIGPGDVA